VADQPPFADYQNEIYLAGLTGVVPDLPVAWDELERRAYEAMDEGAHGYVAGGAGTEDTMRANRTAFARWRIVPRMLRDVSSRDGSVDILGTPMPAPVMLAPIGVMSIVHPDGELATARAAESLGVPMILSSAASHSMEQVAEANIQGPRWFQLYWPRDPDVAASFVARAEHAGYTAIVVTLDTHHLAWRPRDLTLSYLPFLRGIGVANYFSDPAFLAPLESSPAEDLAPAILRFAGMFGNPALTWENLAWLRERTRLPILLKGILHAKDARRAADHGAAGIIVSNHGGRQVDGAIASLDALPRIVETVGDRIPVLFDSGIRCGADAFKALALGARAVLLGRPYLWGLALAGEEGVRTVLKMFLAELDLTLALSGERTFNDVGPNALARLP
jgi:isopentenyl diphosphate isomerase/L-lactate dehydrogenase-like FMN-dependent dehydrogenase